MHLSFKQPHLSISAFPDIELPPFTVIVGLNGSGKSHLLQAIANGHVANSVVVTRPQFNDVNAGIKLLGQDGRVLDLGQAYNGPQAGVDPAAMMMGSFEQARLELLATQRAALEDAANGKLAEILQPGEDVWRLGAAEVAHRLGEKDAGWIEDIFAAAEQTLITPQQDNPRMMRFNYGMQSPQLQAVAQRVAAKLGISPLQVSVTQMKLFAPWGTTDQFSTNLSLLFGKYRDALVQNRLLRMSDAERGTVSAMSEEDFIASFGSPPWDEINETLAAFALPY